MSTITVIGCVLLIGLVICMYNILTTNWETEIDTDEIYTEYNDNLDNPDNLDNSGKEDK